MDAQLWRLTWALPLVIAIGVGLIYWLKRMGVGQSASGSPTEPRLISSTAMSEHTRVLIVEVNHQQFVVFESSAQITVQPLDAIGQLPSPLIFPWRPVRRKS